MRKLDGVLFRDVKLKRCDQVKIRADVPKSISIKVRNHLNIDPSIMFNRLLAVMQRPSDKSMENYFSYELANFPASLLRDGYMRKTNKAQLAAELSKDIQPAAIPHFSPHVIDGGFLLHIVPWSTASSYADVLDQYVEFVDSHYGQNTTVVFDGYGNGPHD